MLAVGGGTLSRVSWKLRELIPKGLVTCSGGQRDTPKRAAGSQQFFLGQYCSPGLSLLLQYTGYRSVTERFCET